MTQTMLGWHFLAKDRRLRFGSQEVVEAGRTYTAEGPLEMCQNGMHACRRALDALTYAPGPVVCRVRLSGELLDNTDKSVARARTILWMADATSLLHEFALSVAIDTLCWREAQGETVDPRSWTALSVKARWVRGQAAARAAVWAATETAAKAAIWAAAETAAETAARDAARDAAEAAAGAAYNLQLETMLESLQTTERIS